HKNGPDFSSNSCNVITTTTDFGVQFQNYSTFLAWMLVVILYKKLLFWGSCIFFFAFVVSVFAHVIQSWPVLVSYFFVVPVLNYFRLMGRGIFSISAVSAIIFLLKRFRQGQVGSNHTTNCYIFYFGHNFFINILYDLLLNINLNVVIISFLKKITMHAK